MKTLKLTETVNYEIEVPDDCTEEQAFDCFLELDSDDRDECVVSVTDRTYELTP